MTQKLCHLLRQALDPIRQEQLLVAWWLRCNTSRRGWLASLVCCRTHSCRGTSWAVGVGVAETGAAGAEAAGAVVAVTAAGLAGGGEGVEEGAGVVLGLELGRAGF
jgi:hypothetical protein